MMKKQSIHIKRYTKVEQMKIGLNSKQAKIVDGQKQQMGLIVDGLNVRQQKWQMEESVDGPHGRWTEVRQQSCQIVEMVDGRNVIGPHGK